MDSPTRHHPRWIRPSSDSYACQNYKDFPTIHVALSAIEPPRRKGMKGPYFDIARLRSLAEGIVTGAANPTNRACASCQCRPSPLSCAQWVSSVSPLRGTVLQDDPHRGNRAARRIWTLCRCYSLCESQLGPYFRALYHVFKFIEDASLLVFTWEFGDDSCPRVSLQGGQSDAHRSPGREASNKNMGNLGGERNRRDSRSMAD